MFRWPDEDPEQHDRWAVLRSSLRQRPKDRREGVRPTHPLQPARRGLLSTFTRNRPLPLALALVCGLGSAAWAFQSISSGISASLVQIAGGATPWPAHGTGPATQQPSHVEAPAQWGDPLPGARMSHSSSAAPHGLALPPATARRNAGSVVLASQYYGIAPHESTPAERGNLIAVLSARPEPADPQPASIPHEAVVSGPAGYPGVPGAADTFAADTERLRPLREAGHSRTASPAARTPSASHLAQMSDWIGLAQSLPVNEATATPSDASALTLPLAVELARLQQRRLLERRVGHRQDSRMPASASEAAAQREGLVNDPGHRAAQVFLDALQARMNHALAQRHERQVYRVVSQARTFWTENRQNSAKRNQLADQALRQARARLGEAQAAQRQQIERLTPLIGQIPPALSWGPASELGLPASSKHLLAAAVANRWAGDQQLVSSALLDAYARHETVARRKDSLHGLLLTHAQVAGALHGQMLKGQRELGEVIQAYERLHMSRLAIVALALEELHSQLHVAHATGRLLQPLHTAAERPQMALAGLDPRP